MAQQKSQEQEVLFQKLGNTWYLFSQIDGEVNYTSLPQGIDPRKMQVELYQVIEDHVKNHTPWHASRRSPDKVI